MDWHQLSTSPSQLHWARFDVIYSELGARVGEEGVAIRDVLMSPKAVGLA